MSDTVLRVEGLSTVLDTEAGLARAIEAMDLTLLRGETFALVGESGCGKSMTALSLLRLLPDNARIASGSVQLDGQDLCSLPEAQMRRIRGRKISIIFQEPATSLNPVMRVGEQIIEVIERHGEGRAAQARQKAVEWLRRVGIPEPERRIDSYPFEMSGGQKQRVMIALALAAEPDLLIADEPTTALDVMTQKQILDLLQDLQRERGLAMLLITHDLGIVSGMAHRIALMYAGQIVEVASAADFFERPAHPYAKLLLQALPDAQKRGSRLAAIAGSVPPLTSVFKGCRFAGRCGDVRPACSEQAVDLLAVRPQHAARCLAYAPALRASFASAKAAGADTAAPATATQASSAAGEAARPASAAPAPIATMSPILRLEGLSVHYPLRGGFFRRGRTRLTVVDDVSFDVPAGKTLALVGESGCGKTTIGKAVLQLLRGKADIDGKALLDGADLFSLNGAALLAARRHIQIIFQDPYASLNPRMRVGEILEEGIVRLMPELPRADMKQQLAQLLDKVGLRPDTLARYPHEFSGGQRQRIAIARALAVQPKLIICDEPTSALDVSVQAQILNLLRSLQQESGVSYLFITHNIGVVEYVADEVVVMQKGRIVEQGPCTRVTGQPENAYTKALLDAVPRITRAQQTQAL